MAAGISQTFWSMTDLTGMVDANLPKQARSLFRSEAAMIKQEHGVYIASCDRCGQTINTGQKSMQQAANYLSRAEGWDSWPRGRVWRNFCPGCVEGGDPDSDLDRVGIGFSRKPSVDDDYS